VPIVAETAPTIGWTIFCLAPVGARPNTICFKLPRWTASLAPACP
jgi:hypothetical protein